MMNMTDQRGCKKRSLDHDLYVSNYKLGYTLWRMSWETAEQQAAARNVPIRSGRSFLWLIMHGPGNSLCRLH